MGRDTNREFMGCDTRIMNYEPIVAGTQSNGFVGTKVSDNAGQAKKETEPVKDYILLPLWTTDPPYSQDLKSSHNVGSKPLSDDGKKVDEDPRKYSECKDQEKEDNVNITNNVNTSGNVNTVSSTVNAADTNKDNAIGGKTSIELPFDPNMYALEDYSIFDFSRDDEDDAAVADINNLDTTIQVSPIPTTRIHKDHPLDQVIEDLQSATQTRKMSKNLEEHGKNPKRNKKDKRGIVIRNKARLVAQGYTQEEMIDYDEVFAPVARIEAIRLFLAYNSFKDFVVYQMVLKSVFLYGKIKEEVYACQPLGFEDPDFPDKVYKVEKALYRLHQAPRAWRGSGDDAVNNDYTYVASHTPGGDTGIFIDQSIEGMFIGLQGNRVQATVKGKHISKFQLLLDEGACYRIGNFDVGENSGKWPLLNHRYKLNLFQGTTVTRVGSFDNNLRGFKFEHFIAFTARKFIKTELYDVIGTVVSVLDAIPFKNYGKDQLRRTIILEDVQGAQLEWWFFYAWCNKFAKLHDERESMGHVVIILQLCKVKYFNEKEGFDPANHIIALLTPVKKEVTADDFFKGAIKKTVGCIRDSDGTYLVCKKFGRSAKEVNSDESSSNVQEKTQLSRKGCMNNLREIKSQFKFLTETLQDFGTMHIFKRTFSQDLDLLEQHLTKDILSQTNCKTILTKLRTTFENAFNSEFKEPLNVDSLKVDLVVIQNTCSEKEDNNSETASNKSVKESSLDSATKDVHAIKYKMSKAKERCMTYFRSIRSHLQVLSKEDLKGIHIEHGFKRAFMSLFS
ncbi:putative ribonuclease H-like domain-containing protein [Tanacetum coccineum]